MSGTNELVCKDTICKKVASFLKLVCRRRRANFQVYDKPTAKLCACIRLWEEVRTIIGGSTDVFSGELKGS